MIMTSHKSSSRLLAIWTGLILVFILGPLVIEFLVSLTPLDYISFPKNSVSLRWYKALLEHSDFMIAAVNSLLLACASAGMALFLGLPAATAVARHNFPGKQSILSVLMSPLFIPVILGALAMLSAFSSWKWSNQPLRIFIAHTIMVLPYVIRTLTASLLAFDYKQVMAAKNLGANQWNVFWLVTLPQIAPGIIAAVLFAFIVSFDDVGMSLFLTGTEFTTLPVQLFTYASYNNDPTIASASVVMVAVSFLMIYLIERFFGLQKLIR